MTGVQTCALPIFALNKTVTGSAYYNSGSEIFEYFRIVDGSTYDGGSPSNWNFWLTPQSTTGWAMINLGQVYNIGKIEFLNTHNRQHNDRSTKDWKIEILSASQQVVHTITGMENDLNIGGTDPIPVTHVDLDSVYTGQYVKFTVVSFWGGSGGLNELRVYESIAGNIPEVSSFVLISCAAALLYFFKR